MKVYAQGTKVKTVIGDIEGLITAVSIRNQAIRYEISYFLNGEYKHVWLEDFEISPASRRQPAGFNREFDTNDDVKYLDMSSAH